ncbi:MAG: class I SAM-dependent methyltransferase [Dichotomicrobium sp.]
MQDEVHPDCRALTERQRATWATGDFHEISRQIVPVSETLCQAADPHAGERVLDVACGSGNTALVAARRYCEVTGIDYVPALIERASQRAAAEGVVIDFQVADAQALPFPDASFDVVVSVFGVMFAPDQEKAASELLRVCRPGGRIALANWMPEHFGKDFFAVHARYMPPPPGLHPPQRWGTESGLEELLGVGTTSISSEKRTNRAYLRSIAHAVDTFCKCFGPTKRALQMTDARAQECLKNDLAAVFQRYNAATDGTLAFDAQYLQAVAIRK